MATKIEYYVDGRGPFFIRNNDMRPVQSLEEAVSVLSTLYHLHLFKKTETANQIIYSSKSCNFSLTLTLIRKE